MLSFLLMFFRFYFQIYRDNKQEFDEEKHGTMELEKGYPLAKIECGNLVIHTNTRPKQQIKASINSCT